MLALIAYIHLTHKTPSLGRYVDEQMSLQTKVQLKLVSLLF